MMIVYPMGDLNTEQLVFALEKAMDTDDGYPGGVGCSTQAFGP